MRIRRMNSGRTEGQKLNHNQRFGGSEMIPDGLLMTH